LIPSTLGIRRSGPWFWVKGSWITALFAGLHSAYGDANFWKVVRKFTLGCTAETKGKTQMSCNSPECRQVYQITETLVRNLQVTWTAFDGDAVDSKRGTRSIFLRFYPANSLYVYDLVLPSPIPDTAEVDIKRFIELNISALNYAAT
jgi:hypothetical protein